jgi:hypothetical protein
MFTGRLLCAARDSNSARIETKFVVAPPQLARLRYWATNSALGFHAAWPSRHITSHYLDTWDYKAYCDSRAGVAPRAKFRIRYYGDGEPGQAAYLEAKLRDARCGYKLRYPFDETILAAPVKAGATVRPRRSSTWIRDLSEIDGLDETLRFNLLNLHPTAEIRFHREYYDSALYPVRLTIDTQLEYRRAGNPDALFKRDPLIVCEIKMPTNPDRRLTGLLASIPFRISRNSKYCRAVSSVCRPFVRRQNWEHYD